MKVKTLEKCNLAIWGEPLQDAVEQMEAICSNDIAPCYAALMADHHIGYSVPVGGVVAYKGAINVNGVGFDIACGNKAIRLDCDAQNIKKDIRRIMDEIQKHISFGVGRKNNEPVESGLFDATEWRDVPLLSSLLSKARAQLGTVGSGNHYVDIFIDDLCDVWVGVHFGSRGLGHSICSDFIRRGGGKDGVHAKPVIFDENSDLGQEYIKCMEIAGRYAYAGRDWVCKRVAEILGANIVEEVHNHHNFAWKERHFDQDLWVIRKGATPAAKGQKGFVGGSMGEYSVILEGIESEDHELSMRSTIHGAGRVLGRMQALGKRNKKTGEVITPGKVIPAYHDEWMQRAAVEVRGGGLDESPYVYKRIGDVLNAHWKSIRILRYLKPIGVCMADARDHDPYKD